MKEVLIGIVILAYVIPFAYMFVADIFDVFKRLAGGYSTHLKPALIMITKSIID